MKVKTPSTRKISAQAIMVGSAIPGAMLSKGVAVYVPGGKIGKLALAVVAAVGAASITGTGTGSDVARGALAGAAIQQAGEALTEMVQPTISNYVNGGEPSKIKDFLSKAVGLSSPDSFYEARYTPYIEEAPVEQLGNPYPFNRSAQLGVG